MEPVELIKEVERKIKEIKISPEELAGMIDHALLHPYEPVESFVRLCKEAKEYKFYAVCVNPYWVHFCADRLEGTDVKVVATVGFPFGQDTPKIKAEAAGDAIRNGASEVDMVMNIGAMKSKDYDTVRYDIANVVDAAYGNPVKVILENGYLTYEEISQACAIAKEAGAAFVKTATGFGPIGATILHVSLMRKAVGEKLGVKASGGIHDFPDVLRMIAAGANRIGSSKSVKIVDGYRWAKHANWDVEDIPCRECPSSEAMTANMPNSVAQYYRMKCSECSFKEPGKSHE